MAPTSLDESAEAIAREIGLDLSYLADENELHFDPFTITVAAALILLKWFLEGVAASLHKRVKGAGEEATDRLTAGLTRLFSSSEAPTDAEVQDAAASVEAESAGRSDGEVGEALDFTSQQLVDYFLREGMPEKTAQRIADRVRAESLRQAGLAAGVGPDAAE